MERNTKLYLGVNILLVSILLVVLSGLSENTYFPEENSENLEDLDKELDIRFSPSGPLYNDLEPNISKYTDEGTDQKKIPIYKVETNRFGARDDPFNLDEDREKIVVLGDSFTFGWGVNKSDRYTEVAERNLNNSSDVQFMNLAVPGTGIIDYYLTLKHKGLQFDPDKAIVGLRYQGVRSEKNAMEFREQARNKFPADTENRNQKIQEFQREKEEELLGKRIENTDFPRYVEKISSLADENNIELIFYHIDNSRDDEKIKAFRDLSEKRDFRFIETPDELVSINHEKIIIREGDSHYNQRAHRILGKHLAEELEKEN